MLQKGRYETNDKDKYEENLFLSILFWSSITFCKHDITQFCLETAAGCCASQLQTELIEKKKENLQYNYITYARRKVDYIFEVKTVSTYVVIGEMFSFNQSQVNFDCNTLY